MPLSGTPSGSCRSTPGIRRCLAPTGTLMSEIGNSMFYSKSGPIRQLYSSTNSLDSQCAMKENHNPLRLQQITTVSRFPKLQECAHFHYDRVELGKVLVSMYEGASGAAVANDDCPRSVYRGFEEDGPDRDYFVTLAVNSNGKTWLIRRTYRNLRKFDRQLHKCVHDRKFSQLTELPKLDFEDITPEQLERVKANLAEYLGRFSELAGNFVNCAPVLNWLELDNRGNRLVGSDDSDININTPAVAACRVTKRYVQQAGDELTLEVGDMISVVDCPPVEESMWWRGKKNLDVGFFPSDCVEVIGGGNVPSSSPQSSRAPVLRKRGKLIAFFRSFLSSRPSRRRLKESGILRERVYGCDLGEHLLNTGQKVPAVLVHCATYLEENGTVDGIYRLSGISSNIQKLRLEFDAEKIPNLREDVYVQDIHSVASVLKLYFRELPNPLLTYQLYEQFVMAIQAADELRLLKIHDVVAQLPPPHFRTLEFLMRHLARIASSAEKTGMNSKNLAIVWAPNLLRSSETENGVEALRGVGVCAIAVEYLIKFADLIFSNRLQSSSLLTRSGYSSKHNRPKSLAVSTPTKLLSLDEARALSRPHFDPTTFIEVGAGPENLPKYHTVIDIPSRNKRRSSQKSPSTWRSLFASKNRKKTWPTRAPLYLSSHAPQQEPSSSAKSPDTTSLQSGTTTRRKLRLAQSVQSLTVSSTASSLHGRPGMDFFRQLRQTEPTVLRTPVTLRRSQNANHNRSLSHDSYFDEIVETTLPQTVIDVIKTIPCSTKWTESGVLVKLSFGENHEVPEESHCEKNGPVAERRRSFSFGRLKPIPVKPANAVPVTVEVHSEQLNRRRKVHRTLSPEALRRHRNLSSRVKRSLSASPKAVHHPADLGSVSTSSSSLAVNSRKNSASGRKSFRRSTSDEDLPAASSVCQPECITDCVMDISTQEDGRTFESTEMELFDEICAEIYGKDADYQSLPSLIPDTTEAWSLPKKTDSLHDIAEILEEEECSRAFRAESLPDLLSNGDHNGKTGMEQSTQPSNRASSSSSLGLGTLFTTPPVTTPSSIRFFSTYYFNGDSRPISLLFPVSPDESIQSPELSPESTIPPHNQVVSSPTYYFGQNLQEMAPSADGVSPKPEIDVQQLRATYFGLTPPSWSPTEVVAVKGNFDEDFPEETVAKETEGGRLAEHESETSGVPTMGCTGRDEVDFAVKQDSMVISDNTDGFLDHQEVSVDAVVPESPVLLSELGLFEGGLAKADFVDLAWDPSVGGNDGFGGLRAVPAGGDLEIRVVPSDPSFSEPSESTFPQSDAVAHISPTVLPDVSVISPSILPTEPASAGPVEYILLLKKSPDDEPPLNLPTGPATAEESPPSVRLLRNRFETTQSTGGSLPEVAVTVVDPAAMPGQTLKEKLHALSDLYRDGPPPELTLQRTFPATAKKPFKPDHPEGARGKSFSASPVLPEKPSHLRSGPLAPPPAGLVKRRKSAEKASEEGSLTSLCSISSSGSGSAAGQVDGKASTKVSQMRQMYESTGPAARSTPADSLHQLAERRPSKSGVPVAPRPRSTIYQQFLA